MVEVGPIMRVLLNASSDVEGVATWSKGELGVSFGVQVRPVDVALGLQMSADGRRPVAGVYSVRLEPWSARFCGEDGAYRTVRNFRCKTAGGELRFLLFCQACGCVRLLAGEDLGKIGTAPCEKCWVVPSEELCKRWHNWGACGCCSGVAAQSASNATPGRDVGCRDAGSATDPEPKAGPSASSLGPAVDGVASGRGA
jgi:hypothetical protein